MNNFRAPYLNNDDGVDLGAGVAILPEGFTQDTGTNTTTSTDGTQQQGSQQAGAQQTGTNQTGTQQPGQNTEPDYTPFLKALSDKAKFNHTPVEVKSFDDVVANYQKGLNYDKLQEKFNTIQNDPRLSKYDKMLQAGKLLGYQSDEDFIEALYSTYYNTVAQQRGLTPEQVRKDHELQQRETEQKKREQTFSQKQSENQMYDRFMKEFPDVKPEDIKPETWAKVNEGMDLAAAYLEQKNKELEGTIATLRQNATNEKHALVGGVTTHGGGESSAEDMFMKGFNSI